MVVFYAALCCVLCRFQVKLFPNGDSQKPAAEVKAAALATLAFWLATTVQPPCSIDPFCQFLVAPSLGFSP